MTKQEIKKILGLSEENFSFYLKMGNIKKISKNNYEYDEKMKDQVLEKSTVFKYCFEDSYIEDLTEFKNFIKYTGPVKVYTKEEIEEYKRKNSIK